MPNLTPATVWRSMVARPLTAGYLVGVAMILLTVRNVVSLSAGIFIFGMLTMLIMLVSVYYELIRIEKLLAAMKSEGVET